MQSARIAAVLTTVLVCGCCFGRAPGKIGAYYFDGWTSGSYHLRERLLTEFADRQPLWGWNDDSLTTVEVQIDYAADHGLSFFAFDWYYPEGPQKTTPLNTGLELYLKARNRNRLEFCLLVANHGGFRIGPQDWDSVWNLWRPLLQHPQHLRTRGKPLLIFFSPRELLSAFGSTETLRTAFAELQTSAARAGLPAIEIAACATPGPENGWSDLRELESAGFTCFTGYNYSGYINKGREKIQAFANMMEGHAHIRERFAAKSSLPYLPVVTAGWDKRPWEDAQSTETQSVYYPDRTPVQLRRFIGQAFDWMNKNPARTMPERIVLIYAWNEYGEGGYVAPTIGNGTRYLEAIRDSLR